MRKGRSSRRSRVSRPIPKGALSEGASAEAGPASTPRVVLSVAPSVVSEVNAESRASSASHASLPSAPPPSAPPPEDDDDDDDDDDEVTPEAPPAVEAKAAPPEPEPEPDPDLPPAPEAVVATEPMPPISEAIGPETRPSATLPPPANPGVVKEEPVTLAAPAPKTAAKKKKKKPQPTSLTPPPVVAPGDDDDDDDPVESAEHVAIQEKFFSDGDLTRHLPVDDELDAIRPSKAMRMAEPEVVQRRERYSRYVKLAVGIAAVVCMAAIGRTLISGGEPPKDKIVPAAETPKAIEAPRATEAPKEEAPKVEVAPAPTTEPVAASASASAAPAEPDVAPSASTAPAERPTGDAKAEKKNAQTALEHRNTAEAIAAGEKSVAIDPTDGEAWLILGAAYQEKGDMAAARRAFASCTKEGKTGPVAECGKMLR